MNKTIRIKNISSVNLSLYQHISLDPERTKEKIKGDWISLPELRHLFSSFLRYYTTFFILQLWSLLQCPPPASPSLGSYWELTALVSLFWNLWTWTDLYYNHLWFSNVQMGCCDTLTSIIVPVSFHNNKPCWIWRQALPFYCVAASRTTSTSDNQACALTHKKTRSMP